jgi:hypothetical protein
VGIKGLCAAGGPDFMNVWVDRAGRLWRAGDNGVGVCLGYDEYLEGLDDETIVAWREEETPGGRNAEFYICGPDETFILTRTGLSRSTRLATSVHSFDGETKAIASGSQSAVEIETEAHDMATRTLKTIETAQVGATDLASIQGRVAWRHTGQDAFTYSRWKNANPRSVLHPIVTGMDLRLAVKGTAGLGAKIEYLLLHWKQDDKRPIRGIYPTNAGQTIAE